ncbi:hypothetical protein ACFFX0_17170 [Citricoccus parietis]|uniref:Uncharacterized protein n=1 Tax=Citricoccus parietis TaxID=592307 RepID=A0ABV5G2Y9_9MICC
MFHETNGEIDPVAEEFLSCGQQATGQFWWVLGLDRGLLSIPSGLRRGLVVLWLGLIRHRRRPPHAGAGPRPPIRSRDHPQR